jgi:class 3 adenylate cyclase
MAARLAEIAGGGEILVSAAIRKELAEAFHLEPRACDSGPGDVFSLELAG